MACHFRFARSLQNSVLARVLFALFHRLEAVQTEDELSDVYTHFMLYYGRDVVAMQNKRAEERKEKKKQHQLMEGTVEDDEEHKGTTMKQSHKLVVDHELLLQYCM